MPTYEYKCDKGHKFEAVQSMKDAPIEICIFCDAPAKKQLSAPGVVFKGGGWTPKHYK